MDVGIEDLNKAFTELNFVCSPENEEFIRWKLENAPIKVEIEQIKLFILSIGSHYSYNREAVIECFKGLTWESK